MGIPGSTKRFGTITRGAKFGSVKMLRPFHWSSMVAWPTNVAARSSGPIFVYRLSGLAGRVRSNAVRIKCRVKRERRYRRPRMIIHDLLLCGIDGGVAPSKLVRPALRVHTNEYSIVGQYDARKAPWRPSRVRQKRGATNCWISVGR